MSEDQTRRDGSGNTGFARAPGVVGGGEAGVATWDRQRKLLEAARRAGPMLPAEMQGEFRALFSPENIAITAGVFAAWGLAHLGGVGFFVDAILLGAGVVLLGAQVVQVARDLGAFLDGAAAARTERELHAAAACLARVVVTIGVTAFLALILKGARQLSSRRRLTGSRNASLPRFGPESGSPNPSGTAPRQRSLFQGTGKKTNPARIRSQSERAAADIMKQHGRNSRQIRQVLESGTDFKPRTFPKGEKLRAFVSQAKPSKSQGSPYWVDEATYGTLKKKYFRNENWDSAGVKSELALPCVNTADAVMETQVTKTHVGVESKILPASDKVYTMNPDGSVVRTIKPMDGGATQVTPSPGAIAPPKPAH